MEAEAMIDEKRLKEMEERSKAASAEPWWVSPNPSPLQVGTVYSTIDRRVNCVAIFGDFVEGGGDEDGDNAAFAAAAHKDVPDLIAEIRHLHTFLATVRKEICCESGPNHAPGAICEHCALSVICAAMLKLDEVTR